MEDYISFIIRLRVNDSQNIDRGYVQHVGSQDYIYFTNFDEAIEFMTNYVNQPVKEYIREEIEDNKQTKKRDKLWKKLFFEKMDDRKFKKIQKLMQDDIKLIINALNKIEIQSENMDIEMGSLDKKWAFACLSYEYPE